MFSSSNGWLILSPMEVMLSSIVIVIFPPPVVLWANAGAIAYKPNQVATIANTTRNIFEFILSSKILDYEKIHWIFAFMNHRIQRIKKLKKLN
jgi:hypothetical protein